MVCPTCNHFTEGGNFCEKCGTKLSAASEHETAVTLESATDLKSKTASASSQPNVYLENAKKISKMYWSYFTTILRKTFSNAQHVGKEQFINGLITVGFYSLFIPLMIFFGFSEYTEYIDSAFLNVVIKPAFAYAIFILLVAAFSFVAIKLGKVPVSYQDVIARFGAFLIPFVGLFALAFVMSILQIKLFALFLFIGFIGSIFTVPAFVIGSFKKDIHVGLDAVYGTILTYIATFITLIIMGKVLFEMIIHMIQEYISSYFFF
jgi:hypothetical protein